MKKSVSTVNLFDELSSKSDQKTHQISNKIYINQKADQEKKTPSLTMQYKSCKTTLIAELQLNDK